MKYCTSEKYGHAQVFSPLRSRAWNQPPRAKTLAGENKSVLRRRESNDDIFASSIYVVENSSRVRFPNDRDSEISAFLANTEQKILIEFQLIKNIFCFYKFRDPHRLISLSKHSPLPTVKKKKYCFHVSVPKNFEKLIELSRNKKKKHRAATGFFNCTYFFLLSLSAKASFTSSMT